MKVIVEHVEAGHAAILRIVGDSGAEIRIDYSEPLTRPPQLEIDAPGGTEINGLPAGVAPEDPDES